MPALEIPFAPTLVCRELTPEQRVARGARLLELPPSNRSFDSDRFQRKKLGTVQHPDAD
jgi:hypothetical protein